MKDKFIEYYKEESKKLNDYINRFNDELIKTDNNFLKQNLESFKELNTDGKLIRGTLINLGYKILKDDYEYSYPLATSFEIFQTAILIHDDIIDKDDIRRGKSTIHSKIKKEYKDEHLGNSIALCMGDYGFYSSIKMIADSYKDDNNLSKVISYFSDIVLKTIEGEVLDVITPFKEINKIENHNLDEDIMNIYKLKTAYYTIIGPLSLGLILGDIEEDKLKEIYDFGYNVGIAFQLQDDLLGIYSDSIDKVIGSDIKEFKTTMLYAYTKKDKELYNDLLEVYGKEIDENKVKKVRNIFEKSGAKTYVEEEIEKLYNKGVEIVNKINWIKNEDKEVLIGFIEYLKGRKK